MTPQLPPIPALAPDRRAQIKSFVLEEIARDERVTRRNRHLLLAAALAALVLLGVAAGWHWLLSPSAGSTGDQTFTVGCADRTGAATDIAIVVVKADGRDPRAICAEQWASGAVVPGTTTAPPLVACARRTAPAAVGVTVYPGAGETCAALGLTDLPAAYAQDSAAFAAVSDGLGTAIGTGCAPEGDVAREGRRLLDAHGLGDWAVVRGDETSCTAFWLFDFAAQRLFLYGGTAE